MLPITSNSLRSDIRYKETVCMLIIDSGGGPSMCKGRQFALREMLIYTAMIITMWDMEPAGGGSWGSLKSNKVIGGEVPVKPLKVWIRRRKAAWRGVTE